MPKQEYMGSTENQIHKKQSAQELILKHVRDIRNRADALELIENKMPWDELTPDESYKLWDFFMWFKMTLKM